MLHLSAVGALGNMLSPAAIHLTKPQAPARFLSILDRGALTPSYEQRRKQWSAHGADMVASFDLLITENLDGVVVCAGKNGDDLEIIAKLVGCIERLDTTKKPFILHLSTVSSSFVEAAHAFCEQHSISYLNYPLTGGVVGSVNASMLILASGDEDLYQRLLPTLSCLGQPKYFGKRITAGCEVKLIGHTLVFHGLMGMTNAINLRAQCFKEKIGAHEQIEFFDFLNAGAGGTRQWDVALKPGIKDNFWHQGFLIKHAVVDTFYTVQLMLNKDMPYFLAIPFLELSLFFSYVLKMYPNENYATQRIARILNEESDKIGAFVKQHQSDNFEKYLKACINALPYEIQKKLLWDVCLAEFERVFQRGNN